MVAKNDFRQLLEHCFEEERPKTAKQPKGKKWWWWAIQNKLSTNEALESSAEFFSKEYDKVKTPNHDLAKLASKLDALSTRAEFIENSIESMLKYSCQYNVQILGIPKEHANDLAEKSIEICLKLFNEIGAKVDEQDIDIAHRSPNRNQDLTAPIIFKFGLLDHLIPTIKKKRKYFEYWMEDKKKV